MKRTAALVVFLATFAAGTAFAANDGRNGKKPTVVSAMTAKMERDHRDHDRGRDNRGNDRRDNDRRDDNRRDNDHNRGRDHAPPAYDHNRRDDRRDDHRRDNDRRDWDHNRRDNDRRDWDRNHNGRNDRWDHYRGDWNRHPNYWDNRRHDRVDYARYRFHYGSYHRPSGYYYRTWHRGDRLPRAWYGNSYVVYDWRPYRLYSPPYGYHWVRVGNDVLLTALATGVVLDVIYDIWY